jgi:hypothetical protein
LLLAALRPSLKLSAYIPGKWPVSFTMFEYVRSLLVGAAAGGERGKDTRRVVHRARRLHGIALFEEIVCATHLAALQTAAASSCINALCQGRHSHPLLLRNLVPRLPEAMSDLARSAEEMALELPTLEALQAFCAEVVSYQGLVEAFSAEAERRGMRHAFEAHRQHFSTTVARLAGSALSAVGALALPVRCYLLARYDENTSAIEKLLTEALAGDIPCLDRDGDVCLPELPQRRPSPRRLLRRPCIIEYHNRRSGALVQDISAGGVGIFFAAGLVPQTPATIEIAGERRLKGVVVWRNGSRAGIRFDEPLSPMDPLLQPQR